MTNRTTYQPSPIEKAVDQILDSISDAATAAYAKNRGTEITEAKFRELIAHVFTNMGTNDWRRRLGLDPDPTYNEEDT